MNLLVLGGTGRTGRLVVEQALSRGHSVTAVVRRPGSIAAHDRLQLVVGDPLSVETLVAPLANQEVLISCLGQRSRRDRSLLRDAATAAMEAMRRTGLRRYLVVSQGLLFPSWNPFIVVLRLVLARHVADSAAMERLVRQSDLEWTIVRPPYLKQGNNLHGYRIQTDAQPDGSWTMQRGDLAAFLLDEAERGQHKRHIVGITSA